jgi:hypothetical protein
VQQVHKHMIAELARKGAHVDLWLFCPYHPDGIVEAFARASADRKPAPGMALAAAQALDLDLSVSWRQFRRHRSRQGGRGVSAARRPARFRRSGGGLVPGSRGCGRVHPRSWCRRR